MMLCWVWLCYQVLAALLPAILSWACNKSVLENQVAKKRKKQTAKKRKKQNLAGMDFASLIDLRNQIDEALTGYKPA